MVENHTSNFWQHALKFRSLLFSRTFRLKTSRLEPCLDAFKNLQEGTVASKQFYNKTRCARVWISVRHEFRSARVMVPNKTLQKKRHCNIRKGLSIWVVRSNREYFFTVTFSTHVQMFLANSPQIAIPLSSCDSEQEFRSSASILIWICFNRKFHAIFII